MSTNEGMVAVVRGLGDQGISVTLMDGNQHFTLVPNSTTQANGSTNQKQPTKSQTKNNNNQPYYQPRQGYNCCCHQQPGYQPGYQPPNYQPPNYHAPPNYQPRQVTNAGCSTVEQGAGKTESAVQAVDGRYASTYQMSHCYVAPTSPEHQVTEFPPQRSNPRSGHGNFVVGGTGSGEADFKAKKTSAFRGAMCWSDRGAVFSPRPSRQADSFAKSLRQYPAISPDRSAEILERLINYTQAKNFSKSSSRCPSSATSRVSSADNKINQNRSYTVNASPRSRSPFEARAQNKITDEKPMKNTKRISDTKDVFQRNYDTLYQQLIAPPSPKSKDTKNTEIQAAAIKVSKKIKTSPLPIPERRSIACESGGVTSLPSASNISKISNARTYTLKSAQTSISLLDEFTSSDISMRKSKSYEVIISDSAEKFRLEILDWFKDVSLNPSEDKEERLLRRNLLMRLKTKLNNMSMELQKNNYLPKKPIVNIVQNVHFAANTGFIRKVNNDNDLYANECCYNPPGFYKNRWSQISPDGLIMNAAPVRIGRRLEKTDINNAGVLILEISNTGLLNNTKNEFAEAIAYWLQTVNLNIKERKRLFNQLIGKLTPIVEQRPESVKEYKSLLKGEVIDILEATPLNVDKYNQTVYRHKIADQLIQNLVKIPYYDYECNVFEPTDSELGKFLREEIKDFFDVNDLTGKIIYFDHIEEDLIDILKAAIDDIRSDKTDEVVDDFGYLLQENMDLNEMEAINAAENIIKHFKTYLHVRDHEEIEIKPDNSPNARSSGTVLVYRSKSQETMKNRFVDASINEVSSGDIQEMADDYKTVLAEVIDEWLSSLSIDKLLKDKKLRKSAVTNLAADIVDRKRFLELNSSKISNQEELDNLKYQIFKWINKFVGENNKDTISNAPELLKRIQNVPEPKLAKTLQNINDPYQPESNIDAITTVVRTWTNELPHEAINHKYLDKSVKDFSENIDKKLKAKPKHPGDVVDKIVAEWCKKVMIAKNEKVVDDLKLRIKKCQLKEEEYAKPDPRLLKTVVRNVEDLIDDWLEAFPEEMLNNNHMFKNRYTIVHDLAIKIADDRSKGMQHKFHDEIVNWISKLPNQPKDKKAFRYEYADILLQIILEADLDKSVSFDEKQNTQEYGYNLIVGTLIDWIKSAPIYRDKDDIIKREQEEVMKMLARAMNCLKHTINGDFETHLMNEITKHVRLLPIGRGKHACCMGENFIEQATIQLLNYLQQQLFYQDLSAQESSDKFLKANVSLWIDELPLTGKEEYNYGQIIEFIEKLKRVRSCCSDTSVRVEIFKFLKSLPIDRKKINDKEFLDRETEKLLIRLSVVPINDARQNAAPGSFHEIKSSVKEMNKSALKNAQIQVTASNASSINSTNRNITSSSEQGSQTSKVGSVTQGINEPIANSTVKDFYNGHRKPEISLNVNNIEHKERIVEEEDYLKEWVDTLPIDKDEKNNVCNELKKRIERIRGNKDAMEDRVMFEDLLDNEIDSVLDGLKQTSELTRNRYGLKAKLIGLVVEENQRLTNYRQQLRDCLSNTLPEDPNTTADGKILDEIAKDDFVDNFIKINFKGHDNLEKLVYKDRIMDQIKKVIEAFSKTHKGKLDAKKLRTDIFDAMYNVPVPTKTELEEQVKEIALKQEITDWFDDLPVTPIKTPDEKLERNRRKSYLAQKIIQLEKFSDEPESMIEHEISNWLEHAPLKNNKNLKEKAEKLMNRIKNNDLLTPAKSDKRKSVDFKDASYQAFTDDLQRRSSSATKCQEKDLQTDFGWSSVNTKRNSKDVPSTSNAGQNAPEKTSSSESVCCKEPRKSNEGKESKQVSQSTQSNITGESEPVKKQSKKSSDVLYRVVTECCDKLPLKGNNANSERMNISSKLMMKLTEVIANPEILNDKFLFESCVENAVDEVLVSISGSAKNNLKKELIDKLEQVRESAKSELEMQNFRKEIYDIITKCSPPPCAPGSVDEFKERLADLVIQINFDPTMDKILLFDEIGRCLAATKRCANKAQVKSLMYNAFLKIRAPKKEVLQDEIEEINIRNEIESWMDNLPLQNGEEDKVRKIRALLAKRIHEIEATISDIKEYDNALTPEISKWLNKLPLKSANSKQINKLTKELVNKLKENSGDRSKVQEPGIGPVQSCSTCRNNDDDEFEDVVNREVSKKKKCRCSKCRNRSSANCWENRNPKCFVALYPCFM